MVAAKLLQFPLLDDWVSEHVRIADLKSLIAKLNVLFYYLVINVELPRRNTTTEQGRINIAQAKDNVSHVL